MYLHNENRKAKMPTVKAIEFAPYLTIASYKGEYISRSGVEHNAIEASGTL